MITSKRLLRLAEQHEIRAIEHAQKAAMYREVVKVQETLAKHSESVKALDELIRNLSGANRT